MKEGSLFVLFCRYEIHRTRMPQIMFLMMSLKPLWKLSTRRGAWAWFHDGSTCGAKVLEYWMISSLKISEPLVLLERSWWAGFNKIDLVRFGFRMWEILIFKWFLPLKIQINSKKPGFGRKISWGHGNTWANSTGHTSHGGVKSYFDAFSSPIEILFSYSTGREFWILMLMARSIVLSNFQHVFNYGSRLVFVQLVWKVIND